MNLWVFTHSPLAALGRGSMIDTAERALIRWATYHVASALGLGVVLVVLALAFLFAPRRARRR